MSGHFGLDWFFAPRKKPTRRSTRALRVEMLESKLPLAGNITAVLAAGTLTLTGDTAPNAVYLTGTGGNVQVWGQGTGINGLPAQAFNGVTNINIFDNGGSDTVAAANLNLAGTLFMSLDSAGVGNDLVSLVSVNLGDTLDIRTDPVNGGGFVTSSAGADAVSIFNVTTGNDAFVVTGGTGGLAGVQNDVITVNRLTANSGNAGTFSLIKSGNGIDAVSVANINIKSDFFIDVSPDFGASNASDSVALASATITGALDIRTDDVFAAAGGGADAVSIASVNSGNLRLNTMGGSDVIAIDNSSFGTGPLGNALLANSINTGSAAGADRDSLTISRSNFFGGLNLTTGADADYVYVATSRFVGPAGVAVHTAVDLGAGNDIMYVVSCVFDNPARTTLTGGTGADFFYAYGNKTTLGATVIFTKPADVETFYSF